MPKIFTPTNQIRHTNVAVVKLTKKGMRFEIACYRNKVVAWREQIEKDIDEVLQIHSVFTNVSKGQVANKHDLQKAFHSEDVTEICKEILAKGELQISDKERHSKLDQVFKEVATMVCDQCLNPETKRPYPITMIERAMKNMHFSVKSNQSSKQQALLVLKKLTKVMPFERARMKVKITLQGEGSKNVREKIMEIECLEIEEEFKNDEDIILITEIDPGTYKEIKQLLEAETFLGTIETINSNIKVEDVEHFGFT
ncbi:ribosome maturation protein SBDS [Coccinella septempunctata]|uniref:ribosome maturation protein SBDS n=1 Tax=Coccinella septempunctata TaxID=41139 RepID=UPI001D092E3B|nr:ribosome maturation protein SBDS [Coccinella septempunctata]